MIGEESYILGLFDTAGTLFLIGFICFKFLIKHSPT